MRQVRQPAPIDFGYVLATLQYRWRWVALPVATFAALGLLAAHLSGDRYVSKATLLIEPPSIADGGSSAVLAAEIETLRLVERYATSDAVLTDLAAGLGSLDEEPKDLRERIAITTSGGPVHGAAGAPVTVEVSFIAPEAELSKRATNEIVAFILSEHAARRTGLADGTMAHFSGEVARLAATLATAEDSLHNFERKNQASLPESLDFRRSQRAELRNQLMGIDRDRSDMQAELTGLAAGSDASSTPAASSQLVDLRESRAALVAVLSPDNPRLAALDARIRAIEAASGTAAPRTELQTRLTALTAQREALAAEIDGLSRSIEGTPSIASELASLQRDVQAAEHYYEIALEKMTAADSGAQVQRLDVEGRIAVLHPATLPEGPDNAGAATFAVLGAAFGLFAGLFLLCAREMFDTTIKRPDDLRAALDIDPLAVIPFLGPTKRRGLQLLNPLGGLG